MLTTLIFNKNFDSFLKQPFMVKKD